MANLLTIPQVAERLAVSTRTVERMIDDKELQAVRVRRSRRIAEKTLNDCIEVAELLTMRYAHLAPGNVARALERLSL